MKLKGISKSIISVNTWTKPCSLRHSSSQVDPVLSDEPRSFKEIPGPKVIPMLGSSWIYFTRKYDVKEFGRYFYSNFGDIVKEVHPRLNIVHLYDHNDIEKLFRQTLKNPQRKAFLFVEHYRSSRPHLYNSGGLLPSNGPEWWRLRQSFQKPVSPLKEARKFLNNSVVINREFVNQIMTPGAIYENFLPYLNKLNLELFWLALYGERRYSFSPEEMKPDSVSSELVNSAVSMNDLTLLIDNTEHIWKRFQTGTYKKMIKFMENMERETLKNMEKLERKPNLDEDDCIAAQYLKNPDLDRKDILAMLVDLLLGGIDTTANTLCFMVNHLSTNKESQEKVIAEVQKLLPNDDSEITVDTINNAEYCRGVMKETFRMTPIAHALARVLHEDMVFSGYLVPKDTVIIVPLITMSEMERYFRNPLKFEPERWIKSSPLYEEHSPYLTLPFSTGLRSCIARRRAEQNILVFLLTVFKKRKIEWCGGKLGTVSPFITKPDKPIHIKIL